MEIRPTTTEDRPAVLALVKAAFTPGDDEVDIVERVWASAGYRPELDLVADDGGTVAGHVLVSMGDLDGRPALGLAPLAVTPERQRSGVGSALMHEAIDRADAAGHPLILLLGHPSYYPRFGFEPAIPQGIRLPYDLHDESAFMMRRLAGYDPSYGGTYRYSWEI